MVCLVQAIIRYGPYATIFKIISDFSTAPDISIFMPLYLNGIRPLQYLWFIRLKRTWFHEGHRFSVWKTRYLENHMPVFTMSWSCCWSLPEDLLKSENRSRQGFRPDDHGWMGTFLHGVTD